MLSNAQSAVIGIVISEAAKLPNERDLVFAAILPV